MRNVKPAATLQFIKNTRNMAIHPKTLPGELDIRMKDEKGKELSDIRLVHYAFASGDLFCGPIFYVTHFQDATMCVRLFFNFLSLFRYFVWLLPAQPDRSPCCFGCWVTCLCLFTLNSYFYKKLYFLLGSYTVKKKTNLTYCCGYLSAGLLFYYLRLKL